MRADFEYRLTRDEYVVGLAALMKQLGQHDDQRTRRLLEQLAVFVAVFLVLAITWPDVLAGFLVGSVLLTILLGAMRGRWLKGATGVSYDPAAADHRVAIAPDGIADRSAMRERSWTWSAVRRIHDLEQAVVLEFVGWDMLVLPNRLWGDGTARRDFLDRSRELATEAVPVETSSKVPSLDACDLLTLGAIGAAVDVLALFVFALPVHRGPGPPVSDAGFLAMFAALLLLGLVLAYVAYRFAETGLIRLHDSSPRSAVGLAHALIWAVPLYMLIAYWGWI